MKSYLIFTTMLGALMAPFLFSTTSYAQVTPFLGVNTAQSSSDHSWMSLENDFVEVLYPQGYEFEATRAANLVEHFSSQVGKSYSIEKPKKFPLILRPEVALPNGFVTLAPRRSEWFLHQAFNPFVGGLDFFEALAIHEYRHVNQFDFSFRSTNMVGYYLFGEFGVAFLNSIGLPSWFFEGDAVWAETQYTHGGRGRSPRFWARLKALLLSDQIPTYDELIGRTYKTALPNHYVFGHFFVARAYRLYGANFWKRVFTGVTAFSISPYRIYRKFEEVSGVPWEQFVADTFKELKEKWEINGDKLSKVTKYQDGYREVRYPMQDGKKLYYLKKDLNGFWELHEKGKGKLKELPIIPSLSKVDLNKGKLVYTQILPDSRYAFRSSSDLFIYDLKSAETERLTEGRRIYHPQWSPSGKNLVALEKGQGAKWRLILRTKKGFRAVPFELGVPLEATFKNERGLYVHFQKVSGERAIASYSLKTFKGKRLTPFTRNNIFNLSAINDGVLFEGDYKERVQVMAIIENKLHACSEEPIMGQSPRKIGSKIYYAGTVAMGEELKSSSLAQCKRVREKEFYGVQGTLNLLGKSEVKRKKESYQKLAKSEASEFSRGLSPNSWSFLGGRGYQVQLMGSNYLGTTSYSAAVGMDAEEEEPFALLGLSYNKYLITANLYGLYEKRNSIVRSGGSAVQWDEMEAGLRLVLPQTWVSGFNQYNFSIGLNGGIIDVGERTGANVDLPNNETLNFYGAEISWQWTRPLTFKDIYPDYGLRTRGFYRKVTSDRRSSYDSDLTFLEASLFLPGIMDDHGVRVRTTYEGQTKGLNNYRHSAVAEASNDYVLSRGFEYTYLDSYHKTSLDYVFPLWYADWNLLDFHYLRRAYLGTFYDYTDYEVAGFTGDVQSFGGELFFETNLLRRLPITYGVRYSNKVDRNQVWDFFLATQIGF